MITCRNCSKNISDRTNKILALRFGIAFKDIAITLVPNYDIIQLNQLHWQDFMNQRNPLASALMAKMRMSATERPQVKLDIITIANKSSI
ncbi:MAG: hypothetical protein RMZ69_22775 [Nostoc sp. ChiQUE01a]|nr:hypothetical protein [Nostoc sp. ChiQUE01a]